MINKCTSLTWEPVNIIQHRPSIKINYVTSNIPDSVKWGCMLYKGPVENK